MQLFYYKAPNGNFGDDLNPWLWYKLRPELFNNNDDTLFVGIGTLINHRLPEERKKIIFGSGVGYGDIPKINNSYNFICVRGPLSAKSLGLEKSMAITDSAMLIKTLNIDKSSNPTDISFMTHCDNTIKADWKKICQYSDLQYIDSRDSVDNVLKQLSTTKLLITEAMHGAIIADALRIPWIPIDLYNSVLHFKWTDWCKTIHIEYKPIQLPPYWTIEGSLPFNERLKNKTKRILKQLGVNDKNWTPPYPKDSCKSTEETIVKKLINLKKGNYSFLSHDNILDNLVSNLEEKLFRIKV